MIYLLTADCIADLIASETEIQRKQAIKIMSGKSFEKYNSWREGLLKILSNIVAKIYFPDDDLLDSALNLAKTIADGPIAGLKAVVKAHDHALSTTLDKQLDYERDTQEVFLDREEFKEGVKAFIEKRKPDFKSIKT